MISGISSRRIALAFAVNIARGQNIRRRGGRLTLAISEMALAAARKSKCILGSDR
jgi:hypothetical protein